MASQVSLEVFEIHEEKPDHAFRTEIPNIVFDLNLNCYTFSLYARIKNVAWDNGFCAWSYQKLSELVGCSRRQIIISMKELEQPFDKLAGAPLIHIQRHRKNEKGADLSNRITLTNVWRINGDYHRKKEKDRGGGVHTVHPPSAHGAPRNKDLRDQDKEQQQAEVKPKPKSVQKVAKEKAASQPVVVFSELKKFSSLPLSDAEKKKLYKLHPDPELLERQAAHFHKSNAKNPIPNCMGWMREALKGDWIPPKGKADIYEDNMAFATEMASKKRVKGQPWVRAWNSIATVYWKSYDEIFKCAREVSKDFSYEEKDFRTKLSMCLVRAIPEMAWETK